MPNFTGQLNNNEIYNALFNMIISQTLISDRLSISHRLCEKARVDGSLYGDTKIYYSTNPLKTKPWGADAEALELLKLHRPPAPEQQAIVLNVFRQISLTLDDYLSKRAWSDEGTFYSFNSQMQVMITKTKEIYDTTTYNCFIGTNKAENQNTKQNQNFEIPARDNSDPENSKLRAQLITEQLANLEIELTDLSREYNDYKQYTSFNTTQVNIIWNSKYRNEIKYIDLPQIFHTDTLEGGLKLGSEVLPERYFGDINTEAVTGDGSSIYALHELEWGEEGEPGYAHVFASELIPEGKIAPAGESYTKNEKVICVIFIDYPPYMSAFEVGSEFWNAKSLTRNHYLTFGRNTLEHLKAYPYIRITETNPETGS